MLEASFQVSILRPYFENLGERLVKSPKVYFLDTGLLSYLVGLRDPALAASGPLGGSLFENLVAVEIYKTLAHRGEEPLFYFWRTAAGVEVDFIVEGRGTAVSNVENASKILAVPVPVEANLSATPRARMARGVAGFRRDFGERAGVGYEVHLGETILPLGDGTIALPYSAL